MPTSRLPVRSPLAPYHTLASAGTGSPEAYFVSLSPARGSGNGTTAPTSPSVKKRRTPNAFFLFRSYMVANKLYPPELKHQNEVSCYVAEKWRAAPLEYRAAFFRMAEEKKQRNEIEGPINRKVTAKKKTKKGKQLRTTGDQSESPPTSLRSHMSNVDSPVCTTSQDIAVLNSFTLSDHLPVFRAAPQPIHPIPPSLLQWGHEMEDELSDDVIEKNSLLSELTPPSSQYAYPGSFHCDTTQPMAVDTAIQPQFDFGLSPQVDMSWPTEFAFGDVTDAFTYPPPFGTYLPW